MAGVVIHVPSSAPSESPVKEVETRDAGKTPPVVCFNLFSLREMNGRESTRQGADLPTQT